jgi:hypothetical protein
MQKKWYMLYTKPKLEKKVASFLDKNGVESFCPVTRRQEQKYRRNRFIDEPVFDSRIFARLGERDFDILKKVSNIAGVLFWRNEFAIIRDDEVEAIKDFCRNYENVKLEKSAVDIDLPLNFVDDHRYSIDGNTVVVKQLAVKLTLPSVGFIMTAETEADYGLGKMPVGQRKIAKIHN